MSTRVTVHGISRDPTSGAIMLSVAIGRTPAQAYSAAVDANEPGFGSVSVDGPLFFELSELSLQRYGNSTLYHMEVGALVLAFARGHPLPVFPARLGSTPYARPPSIPRLAWNQARRLLFRIGLLEPKVWTHPDYREDV